MTEYVGNEREIAAREKAATERLTTCNFCRHKSGPLQAEDAGFDSEYRLHPTQICAECPDCQPELKDRDEKLAALEDGMRAKIAEFRSRRAWRQSRLDRLCDELSDTLDRILSPKGE